MLKRHQQNGIKTMATLVKDMLYHLADELPESATWSDVLEKVRFCRAVEGGIRAADCGDFASQEELRAAFARWDVDIGR